MQNSSDVKRAITRREPIKLVVIPIETEGCCSLLEWDCFQRGCGSIVCSGHKLCKGAFSVVSDAENLTAQASVFYELGVTTGWQWVGPTNSY